MAKTQMTLGRVDIVDLPDLGIENIPAKIDTGAYRSSLHCKNVHLDGKTLKFTLITEEGAQEYTTDRWKEKSIRSSNGKAETRFVIKTTIRIFGKNYQASMSLTDRSKMKNPILIGRKLLSNKFLVDVSQENLSFQQKQSTNQ